jgi:hypothetical protein
VAKVQHQKIDFVKRSRFLSNTVGFEEGLLAILLDACRTQSGKAMLIDGKLPGKEFVDRQRITAAGLLKGEQTAADCGNDLSLPANNPPFGSGRGQIRNC